MKRLLAAGLCAFALMSAVSVSPVDAQQMYARHKAQAHLSFRHTGLYTTLLALDPKAKKSTPVVGVPGVVTTGTGGYLDSTYFTINGGLANAETSAVISTATWADIGRTSAILDTGAVVCRLTLTPIVGGGVVDSFYVIPQVSGDGVIFESCGLLINTVPTNPVTGASILTAAIPVALLGNGTGTIAFRDTWTSRTGVDIFGLNTWPSIRFIIKPGISETTTGHFYKADLAYYSAGSMPNQ